MHLFPALPYTPKIFRSAKESVVVMYLWDTKAREDLAAGLRAKVETYEEWYAGLDASLSRVIVRVDKTVDGEVVESVRLPAGLDERREWFSELWPPRIMGEVVAAIAAGAYDDELVGKS
jgi:hypothetical protein